VRDGHVHHVRGDRNHPVSRGKLCRKCTAAYNGALLDPEARLTRPRVRAGAKGAGRWREVSWDEACALVARRVTDIVDGPGAQTILATHYAGKPLPDAYGFPLRLKTPLKLGFKQPKWIYAMEVTNIYPGGYWEDGGYNWFSGL